MFKLIWILQAMKDFLIAFPGLIIGIYAIFISSSDALEKYLESDRAFDFTAKQALQYKKINDFLLRYKIYVGVISGFLLIISFVLWCFFEF
jgi:hypothetical protein